MKKNMITNGGRLCFALYLVPVCLAVLLCIQAQRLNAQTSIPGGTYSYKFDPNLDTSYVVGSGVQIAYKTNTAPPGGGQVSVLQDTSGATASWTVQNFGIVGLADGEAGGTQNSPFYGMFFYTTGQITIINEANARIATGNVTGATRSAIYALNGVLNLTNRGYIYGGAHGIYAKRGEITNSGTIIGNNTARTGIWFEDADYTGIVRNSGYVVGGSNGIHLAGGGEVYNTGGGEILGRAREGIYSQRNVLVINDASSIAGASRGIAVSLSGTVINRNGAFITGSTSNALLLYLGGDVENNNSEIYAIGVGARAVSLGASGGTVKNLNHGYIHADNGPGVHVEGAVHVINDETSRIESNGAQPNGAAVNLTGLTGTLTLTNSGTLSGGVKGVHLNAFGGHLITNNAGGIIESKLDHGAPGSLVDGYVGGAIIQAEASAIVTSTIHNAGLISGERHGIFMTNGVEITNSGTIRATGPAVASVYLSATNGARSTITLDTGSVLEGDVLSAALSGNRVILKGTGMEDSNFLGTRTGAGFESLVMQGTDWTLGGTVAITGTGAAALAVDSGTLTLSGELALPGSAGISLGAGGLLNLDFATPTLTLANTISGAGGLMYSGAGYLALTGSNTYTGRTVIDSGTVKGNIGSSALHLETAGATYIVADGVTRATLSNITGIGTVDIQGANLVFDVVDPLVTQTYGFGGTLDTSGGNKLIKSGAGAFELTESLASKLDGGTVVENGTLRLGDKTFIVTTGLVLGSGTTAGLIQYTGAGAWDIDVTLAGAGGGFSVGSGTQALAINVHGAGAFVKGGDGALDIRGVTFDAGVNATEVRGGSLIGDRNTLRGDISLTNNGTVVYDHSGAAFTDNRLISGAGNLIKTGDGLLNLTGNNTYTGDTTVRSGTLQGNVGSGQLTVATGATYKVADGRPEFSLSGIMGGGNVDLNAASLRLDVAAGTTSVFDFSGSLISSNATSKFIKSGAGTVELLSPVVLQGGAEIREGTLRLANQNLINAPIVLGTGSTSGLIEYNSGVAWAHDVTLATGGGGGFSVAGGTQTLTNTFAIKGAGSFVKGGAGTLDITAANIENITSGSVVVRDGKLRGDTTKFKAGGMTLAAASSEVEFYQAASGSYGGVISGPGALVKTGNGDLALTGANSYGDTIIRGGVLTGNIGQGTLTVASSGTYRVSASLTEFSVAGVLGDGTIDMANASMVLNVASGTTVFDFAGTLIGGNQFIKTGSGTLELLSAVALSAGAAIQDGTVKLADQSFLRAPVVVGTATSTAMIHYTGADAWAHAMRFQGHGGGFLVESGTVKIAAAMAFDSGSKFIKTGAGTLDITGATSAGAGLAEVHGGVLSGRAASMPSGGVDVSAGAAVAFVETADATYAGAVSGSGALIKDGSGALTLTGALTYTGATIIQRGSLKRPAGLGWAPNMALTIGSAGSFETAGSDVALASLANNGAIYVDAIVNSRAGVIMHADRVTVTGSATGSGKVLVRLAENTSVNTGDAVATVFQITGQNASNYTAGLAERAVVGAYDWKVTSSGNSVLLQVGERSAEVSAVGGIDAATYLIGKSSFTSLSQRLMAARSGDTQGRPFQVWANGLWRQDKFTADLYDGAESRISGIQAGVDWNSSKASDRPLTFGFYYDYASSDVELANDNGKSRTDSYGLGVYGSYRTKPFYVDVILRNAREDYEVTIPFSKPFKTGGYSMAASIEVGGVVTNNSPWNVEPQAQVVFQRHKIDDMVDGMGRSISVESADTIEGRAGLRLWREFASDGRRTAFIPYLRASLIYEANGEGSIAFLPKTSADREINFYNKYGGASGMIDGGFSFEFKRGFRLQAEGAWYYGDKMRGFSANLAAAFVW